MYLNWFDCHLPGCGGFTGYFPSNAKNCTALVSQLKRHKSFSHDRPYAQLSILPDLKFCININSSQALYRLLPSPPMQPTLFPPHKHRFFFFGDGGICDGVLFVQCVSYGIRVGCKRAISNLFGPFDHNQLYSCVTQYHNIEILSSAGPWLSAAGNQARTALVTPPDLSNRKPSCIQTHI